ncbi:MAG TPA: CvpA family protein [Chitinophagaceae bacterium]|nr:CvpA family protein [Chitinophagaceae bacterium]
MNWIDIVLIVVVLLAVFAGWHRGFILGSLDLLSWTGSLVIGYLLYPYTANLIDNIFSLGAWLLPLAFLLTAILARIAIGFIVRLILRAVPHDAHPHNANKFLGIIPGAINGWLFAIIVSALLLSVPLKDSITNEARESRIAGKLALQSEWANRKLAPVFDSAIKQTMNSLTVHPSSGEKVELRYKTDNTINRPDLEARMLIMVNRERAKVGLKPLQADPELTPVARAHSKDMFNRGYFAHMNPDGKDPFDRMKDWKITFINAGENLALAPTLEIAHNNLMNSPGHKANILHKRFGRLGIGVVDGGKHGLMISQEFRN